MQHEVRRRESERMRSPRVSSRRHAIQHGAVFGLSHGLDQLAYFRPAIKDEQVRA